MRPHPIADWNDLDLDTPTGVLVSTVDLVVLRWDDGDDPGDSGITPPSTPSSTDDACTVASSSPTVTCPGRT